jgi:hypothetical protein
VVGFTKAAQLNRLLDNFGDSNLTNLEQSGDQHHRDGYP